MYTHIHHFDLFSSNMNRQKVKHVGSYTWRIPFPGKSS